MKTFPLMYQLLANVGLILTKPGRFLFSGMDTRDTDRQPRFWNPHVEKCRHTKNFNSKHKIRSYLAVDRYKHPLRTEMHNCKICIFGVVTRPGRTPSSQFPHRVVNYLAK